MCAALLGLYFQLTMSSILCLGTASLIDDQPSLVHDMMQTDPTDTLCRKDIGKAQRLRKWSRGHQFIVRGGGHIDAWQPLYRLEVNRAYKTMYPCLYIGDKQCRGSQFVYYSN